LGLESRKEDIEVLLELGKTKVIFCCCFMPGPIDVIEDFVEVGVTIGSLVI